MRILLLNLYYPPDTSATAKMAEAAVNALSEKHEVVVVCGRPSYEPAERRRWRLWQREKWGKASVIRVGSTDYARTRMKRRAINYLSYAALALPRALFVRCDVVLAMTDPPFEGILGALIALLKGKPYIYNIRDLYPEMAVGGALMEPGRAARLWEKLHRWALRRAEKIIVLGEDMRARIVSKGVASERVKIARDGAELAPVRGNETLDAGVIRQIRGEDRFIFLHAGNLGFYGAWETLVEAANLAERQLPGTVLVFLGGGAEAERVRQLAAGSKAVRFLPFFEASKVPSVLAAGDVHVITVKSGLEGVVVPSKLYGVLAAGMPILAVAEEGCEARTIAVSRGCGEGASPKSPEDVAKAMVNMAAQGPDSERLGEMGRAARATASEFAREKELRKFAEILESALRH